MKKKIGDLTLREIKNIYEISCNGMPDQLCDGHGCNECIIHATLTLNLDEEIEVPE